jgi:lipoate-protein ligase B
MTIPGTTAEFKTQFMFAVDAMKPFQNERGGSATWINPAQIAFIEISEE